MTEDRPPGSLALEIVVEPEADEVLDRLVGAQPRDDELWEPYVAALSSLWQSERPDHYGEVGIVLVGEDRIRELNRDYRRQDVTTDVLAFDLSDEPECVEGEIYIGVNVADGQAQEWGNTLAEELARLMIHGMLHLAGHDHHTPDDEKRMAEASARWIGSWRESRGPFASSEKE